LLTKTESIINANYLASFASAKAPGWELDFVYDHLLQKKSYLLAKRLLDILGSLILFVFLLSWLVPIIAIFVKLDSRGPIFFVQQRVGRKGRLFRCYKFRTMVPNAEADEKQADYDDHRITGIGRFLRESNLDELPQLLNVIIGNMSLVGPRPHMLADQRRFSEIIPAYAFRNAVKPGITGLAQVSGFCGPTTNEESISGRFNRDAYYIRQAGFFLDMKIIGKTIIRQCRRLRMH
jgi:putative colanic acid biosysnthesis UDP-glucose lipid carrier transferase